MVAGRAQCTFASRVQLKGGLEIGSLHRQRNFPCLLLPGPTLGTELAGLSPAYVEALVQKAKSQGQRGRLAEYRYWAFKMMAKVKLISHSSFLLKLQSTSAARGRLH